MNNQTLKKLLLEKICYVYAVKIAGYLDIMYGTSTHVWTPNFNYLEEYERHNYDKDRIRITIDGDGNVNEINFIRTIPNNEDERLRALVGMRRRAELPAPPPPEIVEIKFKNKETTIREICELVDVPLLIAAGTSAMREIAAFEDPARNSIGAIKKILGINSSADLVNTEKREVLLEINRK
ncbi:MAG TPA: hypothetical protein VNX68_04385 [Nitrosopumilaceae archaeon]|jgi:hypothetical protein|nr:hypothetical protein [Nitrosopumilaceae archaeon]